MIKYLGSFLKGCMLFLKLAELNLLAHCGGPKKPGLPQFLKPCSHCGTVADLWGAFSFVFLKKSQRSNEGSLHELLSHMTLVVRV